MNKLESRISKFLKELDLDDQKAKYLAFQINSEREFEKEESSNVQNDNILAIENIECSGTY